MCIKEHQPPLNIDEQINNLKSLNLIIDDENFAKDFLNDVSYFRFIKAYSIGLKPKNGTYHSSTTFEQLVELYRFNANFRQLLFSKIEYVEINLRCRLGNYVSEKYGIFGYENADNFRDEQHHSEITNEIQNEVSRARKSAFVKNYYNNYDGKIPMYALVELFSFGTLSKFYKNLRNEDKKAIAKVYGIGYTYLESWIEHIAYVRNICAHYGRLYNINLIKKPALYKEYAAAGIDNYKVYSTLLCLKHLLKHDRHWHEFVDNIELLIEKYPSVKIELLGFPKENWKELLEQ